MAMQVHLPAWGKILAVFGKMLAKLVRALELPMKYAAPQSWLAKMHTYMLQCNNLTTFTICARVNAIGIR